MPSEKNHYKVGCYIWCSDEGLAGCYPFHFSAVPDVTVHPLMTTVPTEYNLLNGINMWHSLTSIYQWCADRILSLFIKCAALERVEVHVCHLSWLLTRTKMLRLCGRSSKRDVGSTNKHPKFCTATENHRWSCRILMPEQEITLATLRLVMIVRRLTYGTSSGGTAGRVLAVAWLAVEWLGLA